MANRQRHQRFSAYLPLKMDQQADCDSISYIPGNGKIEIGIYPRLGQSIFPDIPKVEIVLRHGIKAPEKFPLTRGGFSIREKQNETYLVYSIGTHGGILEVEKGFGPATDYQAIAIIATSSGEVVKVVIGDGTQAGDNLASFALYAMQKMDFDTRAKPIEAKNMITRVEPINEITLTHDFSATIKLPGGAEYSQPGPVSALREKGVTPKADFSYWKRAWSWADGDKIALLAVDFSDRYHGAIFNDEKQMPGNIICDNLQVTITSVANLLKS